MEKKIRKIRKWLLLFMIMLFISGLTAIPAETELAFLTGIFRPDTAMGSWLRRVYIGLVNTNEQYPFLAYGYDWLAFAHFVLALLFIGPYRDPVRNRWVIEFGLMACFLIIPFAFIAGYFRGIPVGWRLIDCSFGLIGFIPLLYCRSKIVAMEKSPTHTDPVFV